VSSKGAAIEVTVDFRDGNTVIPTVLVATPTGALITALTPHPDDDEEIELACVRCSGEGTKGGRWDDQAWFFYGEYNRDGGWDDEESYAYSSPSARRCDACAGTGKSGRTMTAGEMRKQQWDEQVSLLDGERMSLRDRDICPDCGFGGCSERCWQTDSDWVQRVAGCHTGEEAMIWAEELFRQLAYRPDISSNHEPPLTTTEIDEWAAAMSDSTAQLSEEIDGA
jgi:hypothetical protein